MGQAQSQKARNCFGCTMNEDPQSLMWKFYLRDECEELIDQCVWAEPVLEQLKDLQQAPIHKFYRELKEIDTFYREKAAKKVRSKPKSQTSSIKRDGAQDIIQMIDKSELTEDDISQSLQQQQQQVNRIIVGVDSIVSHSIVSGSSTPSHAYQEKQSLKSQLELDVQQRECIVSQINYFLRATMCFKDHLKSNEHQLHLIFKLYISAFIMSYTNPKQEDLVKVVFEIQQFSRVMASCLHQYYDVERVPSQDYMKLLNQESMVNFVICLVMDERMIYDILYKIIAENQYETIATMKITFGGLRTKTSADLNIPVKYQLNQKTFEFLQEIYPDCESYYEIAPYELAINQLRKIRDRFSPSSKLKIIIKMFQLILKSIQKFYRRHSFPFDGAIENDDMLPILIYILIKSDMYDLGVHIYMIEKLATTKLLQGQSGYNMVSLQLASACVQSM